MCICVCFLTVSEASPDLHVRNLEGGLHSTRVVSDQVSILHSNLCITLLPHRKGGSLSKTNSGKSIYHKI